MPPSTATNVLEARLTETTRYTVTPARATRDRRRQQAASRTDQPLGVVLDARRLGVTGQIAHAESAAEVHRSQLAEVDETRERLDASLERLELDDLRADVCMDPLELEQR